MKIKFLIGYPATSFATEWQEIKKLPESEPAPDYDTFILFKALELNKNLEKELIKARRNLHLPENGLSWEEYQKRENHTNHSKEEDDNILFFILNSHKEKYKIMNKIYVHPQVAEQLENLILGYFVEPSFRGIGNSLRGATVGDYESEDDFDENTEVDTVSIDISKKISKNELFKHINSHWNEILRFMNLLPEVKRFYISLRDIKIVELRDNQKLKYNQIAQQIIKEFSIDDINGSINEDSVKTSYMRAKNKIEELAEKYEK